MSLAFLAPQFLWLLLALPLVVLLHFIRARKKRLDVSALFLWRRAQEFARRRRRFSPTWLLFLQLLFVAAAALALAQPSLHLGGAPDRVLVIDASASMEAKDSQGLRLARAVSQAESVLSTSGRAAVVRAGLDAIVLQPLTTDHAAVRRALTSLVAGDSTADLGRALQLAHSIAPGAEIYLFSDSAPPPDVDVTWRPIEGDGRNLGISAFELRGSQAFVSVVSNDPRPEQLELNLSRDDTPVGSTTMLVPAKGQANASLSFDGKPGVYRAEIDVPGWDALPLDNSAYALWRILRVRLADPAPVLARALRAVPNVEVDSGPAGQGGYDVLVQVGAVPSELKPGNYIFLEPAVKAPKVETISDWQRTDPLLRFVDLTDVTVGVDPRLPPLPDKLGDWQVLAQTGTLAPAIVQLKTGELNVIAFRFNPAQTDMVNRAAFPILVANLTDAFRGSGRLVMGSLLPSTLVRLNGAATSLRRATTPGIYQFDGRRYAVSLLSAAESRLPVPAATPSGRTSSQGVSQRRQSVALWLVLLALLALVLEWLLWSWGNRGWAR